MTLASLAMVRMRSRAFILLGLRPRARYAREPQTESAPADPISRQHSEAVRSNPNPIWSLAKLDIPYNPLSELTHER